MLLAVEIDNSSLNFGLFDTAVGERLVKSFKIATDVKRTADEYALAVSGMLSLLGVKREAVTASIIASVVPQLTDVIAAMLEELTGTRAMVVGRGIKNGFPIKLDNPLELGADLVADAAAVIALKAKEKNKKIPCIVIDMGAATTAFALNPCGEYMGGAITVGVGMSFEALHANTALLPTVSTLKPAHAIGKSSGEALRSGVILGSAATVDRFIDSFADELDCAEPYVVATGEYAEAIIPFCKHSVKYIAELTLMGLLCIYKNNTKA